MKKILVCVLAMSLALGMMPVAYGAATNPGAVAEVKKSGETITVTVKLPAVEKLTACVVSVEFDPKVVSIPDNEGGYAATHEVQGETDPIPNFIGEHTGGLPDGVDNVVKNAYVNSGSVTKTEETAFAVFTFTVTDKTAKETDFIVNLEQYYAEGLTIADGEGMVILEKTVAMEEEDTTDKDGDGDAAAELAQQIKDFLKQIGLESLLEDKTINDMIEQFADMFGGLGSGDFSEILDSIIGGSSGELNFDEIIAFFTGLIDEIMKLFTGGGATTKKPDATTTTTEETTTEETTEETTGSSNVDNGGNAAGDAGIALAVTVCLAAAAAFVLSKKKED